jgi:hypothetical protein
LNPLFAKHTDSPMGGRPAVPPVFDRELRTEAPDFKQAAIRENPQTHRYSFSLRSSTAGYILLEIHPVAELVL